MAYARPLDCSCVAHAHLEHAFDLAHRAAQVLLEQVDPHVAAAVKEAIEEEVVGEGGPTSERPLQIVRSPSDRRRVVEQHPPLSVPPLPLSLDDVARELRGDRRAALAKEHAAEAQT